MGAICVASDRSIQVAVHHQIKQHTGAGQRRDIYKGRMR
jgi:hypothetical protein